MIFNSLYVNVMNANKNRSNFLIVTEICEFVMKGVCIQTLNSEIFAVSLYIQICDLKSLPHKTFTFNVLGFKI